MIRVPVLPSTPTTRDHAVRRRLAPIVAGTAMVVALAACGSAPPAAPATATGGPSIVALTGAPAASPLPTTGPSTGAGPSAPSGSSSILSSHADPDLEARLPAEVSGKPLQRSSATLAALLASGGDRTAIDAFLKSLGKSEADGSFASAYDASNTLGGGIFAFRIAGVTSDVLLPAIVSVEQSDLGAGATTRQANVGGKAVTIVSVGDDVNDTEWVHGSGEVVFVVHAPDEAHAAAFLQALP